MEVVEGGLGAGVLAKPFHPSALFLSLSLLAYCLSATCVRVRDALHLLLLCTWDLAAAVIYQTAFFFFLPLSFRFSFARMLHSVIIT
jgi:hypothetical protein